MAHAISIRENGIVEAAFAQTPAWHNLGTLVPDLMTPAAALKLANLDWTVSLAPIQTIDEFGGKRITDYRAIIRDDSFEALGIVRKAYHPIQNVEQMEIIEALIGQGVSVSALGALHGGKQVFWTCKMDASLDLKGDKIDKYLILNSGHDGATALQVWFSPIRVVCQNTLNVALRGAVDKVHIRHTANAASRISSAKQILGIANNYYGNINEVFGKMKSASMSADQFINDMLYPIFTDESEGETIEQKVENLSTQTKNKIEKIERNFTKAPGAENTIFGGYNAFTYYTSNQQVVSDYGKTTQAERRFTSIMEGVGQKLQQKAFEKALALIA